MSRARAVSPTRRHHRPVVAVGVVALVATLCTAALAAIGGDSGRLPTDGTVTLHARVAPPGDIARHGPGRERPPTAPSDNLTWPLHGAITGRFGEPRAGHMHEGIDIPMPAGTPIRAASNGTVVMREWQAGYGRYTCVAHVRITTCYGHQSRFGTKLGAKVRRGQVIGFVGNTGDTGVNHLHFEVRRGTEPWGEPVNPVKKLPRGG